LPALNLAIPNIALMIRLVAAGTTEAMTQDYVKYARAKGVRPRRIVGRHVLRNILIPVVTVIGVEFGSLVAFSTITETVFAWPGMGKLLIDSVYQLDRPVVVAYVLLATLLFVAVNFLVDILYAALDPRVNSRENRHERTADSRLCRYDAARKGAASRCATGRPRAARRSCSASWWRWPAGTIHRAAEPA
jgi:ABC-type dipeptide/oligopeptide/nickel transport system permease component